MKELIQFTQNGCSVRVSPLIEGFFVEVDSIPLPCTYESIDAVERAVVIYSNGGYDRLKELVSDTPVTLNSLVNVQ